MGYLKIIDILKKFCNITVVLYTANLDIQVKNLSVRQSLNSCKGFNNKQAFKSFKLMITKKNSTHVYYT